jgi:septum formation topological specificity factor MinE
MKILGILMRSKLGSSTSSDISDSLKSVLAAQRATEEERSGYANVMYRSLLEEIKEFEGL